MFYATLRLRFHHNDGFMLQIKACNSDIIRTIIHYLTLTQFFIHLCMSIIFIILAAVCNALMDVLSTRYDISVFRDSKFDWFLDWRISWKNKWKNGNIRNGERFFLSSTWLVFLTDGWHLAKSLMLAFISLAIIFYKPIFGNLDIFLFCIVWGIVFEVSYNKIFVK